LTQDLIAQMLGVRRTTVTLEAQSLQHKEQLERCACECYATCNRRNFRSKSECDFERLPSRRLRLGREGENPMPMYYFHLRNEDAIQDVDGTELSDIGAARAHADVVARELKFKADTFLDEAWSCWSMHVHDGEGQELFSFPMSDVESDKGR
jgi:Domain of unknown function (DUF6894)